MRHFRLARGVHVIRAGGAAAAFTSAARAARAVRDGDVDVLVGAIPFDADEPAALVRPAWIHRRTAAAHVPARLPRIVSTKDVPGQAEYLGRLDRVLALLRRGEVLKVVLSRAVECRWDRPVDPLAVLGHLMARNPRANGFAVDVSMADSGLGTLVGASPELLVSKRGRALTLGPLAGTAPRHPDEDLDRLARERLLASDKDLREHAFVVEGIRRCLAPICAELSIPERPKVFATPDVWHLGTPITGVLRDPDATALDVALLLHPTPAVCGTPTDRARGIIRSLDGRRGFYGGTVGWCDSAGDGDWIVTIRCLQLSAGETEGRLYAGGGIIATSDAAAEFDETTAKLRTLLRVLDVPAAQLAAGGPPT
ncbi:isochorismate synthase [Nocardia blacklockiae]|uniref:isochorismate synthase n=1 Tax=Nocardia blacklockiae TaxID=480036 RepID=UPI001893D41C|nr:isochorismate synthase [Nocardia blacklockiae]MBF6169878.1 isochorismate synthase [Nocardia blacklockiae]